MTDDARAPYDRAAIRDYEAEAASIASAGGYANPPNPNAAPIPLPSARERTVTLHLPEAALPTPGHVISEYRQWCERKVAAWTALVAAQELLAPLAEKLAVREAEVAGTITGSNAEQRKAALLIALTEDGEYQAHLDKQRRLQAVARKAEAELSIAREWCRWGYATLLCLAGTVAVEGTP